MTMIVRITNSMLNSSDATPTEGQRSSTYLTDTETSQMIATRMGWLSVCEDDSCVYIFHFPLHEHIHTDYHMHLHN